MQVGSDSSINLLCSSQYFLHLIIALGKLLEENIPIKDPEQLCSVSGEQKREVNLKYYGSKCKVIPDTSSLLLIFETVRLVISQTTQLNIDYLHKYV